MAEQEMSLRDKQIAEREKKMADLNPPMERVRVTPANDDLRRVLAHPSGIAFPESGSVEWPLDKFTRRRIAEGDVTREEKEEIRSGGSRPASLPAA